MDFDLFLSSPRWEILQILAKTPSSPVEIAEKLNTTVSYISQQLKLLDAANLLTKVKTGASLKGKPRSLFSLSNEFFYLTILSKDLTCKKLLPLTDHHKIILNIWSIKDSNLHYYFEKTYWELEEDIDEIDAIYITNPDIDPEMIVVTESKKIKLKIENYIKNLKKQIKVSFINRSSIKKSSNSEIIFVYDPKLILKDLKGGELKRDE